MIRRLLLLLALGLPLAITAAASAVIIDLGDGTGNTSAPSPDPGWDNVGSGNAGLSCVYLGNGWVLTANHVGAGDSGFRGILYPWLPGTAVRLHNPDQSYADLLMYRLVAPYPPLADLAIRSTAPAAGTSLVMIGNGSDRGAPTIWGGLNGYKWGAGATKRWGKNLVEIESNFDSDLGTHVFATDFDESHPANSKDEAQAATGDSGGAVFAGSELAGTMIAVSVYVGQPPQTSLYTNETFAADLSVYRDEIVEMPEPAGGLWAGAALLAILANAGTRRACPGTGCAASSPPRA
jgi:hypothetical protein